MHARAGRHVIHRSATTSLRTKDFPGGHTMKMRCLYFGLVLSLLAVGMTQGADEPEGVTWAEWRFNSDFNASGELTADKASDSDSLIRLNAAATAVSVAGGKVVFTQTGPDDFLRVDVDDMVENGDGGYTNEYTMIFDLKATGADWLPIYNTGYNNYNAADLWVAADGSVGSGSYSDPGVVPPDAWVRLVVVRRLEGGSWVRDLYVSGTKVFAELGAEGLDGNSSLYTNAQQDEGQFTIISDADASAYAGCELDNFAFVAAALSEEEVADLGAYDTQGIFGVAGLAAEPVPVDEATDVLRDTTLSWLPSETARTHDVYFGTSWDDVNDADRDNPLDVLVSEGQSQATYQPPTVLDYGQTYYWRIDEVNAAPDYTLFKGKVWSFTVEPLAYSVEGIIARTNGVSEPGIGPENTVNESGLGTDGTHSVESSDMWVATAPEGSALYIQYEFDRLYQLHDMQVWNYNVQFELLLGFGIQEATVSHSENGVDWTVLGDVTLNQATGMPTYTANTTIDFGGTAARYVRLTVNSGYGTTGQFGLSEVRFLHIPTHARRPEPADGTVDVDIDTVLTWRAGRQADAHEVYVSADEAVVADGTALVDTVVDTSYATTGLDLATTYYWKIDEVNETEAVRSWEGPIWSFATEAFVVVDDFESYDDADNLIYDTWLDGWVNDTGSTVGYFEEPFAERTIVHGGRQSMPLFYDNATAGVSEADLDLDEAQDWTRAGIGTLTFYFYGAADNAADQLYVKINGVKVGYDGDAGALTEAQWHQWDIDLASVGTNLTSVGSLTIGTEGSGAGVVYVDDIRLYR